MCGRIGLALSCWKRKDPSCPGIIAHDMYVSCMYDEFITVVSTFDRGVDVMLW